MEKEINKWNGWWRWPLIPFGSLIGAFLGSAVFMLIQWYGLKMQGGSESGWFFVYILPIMKDAIFGFLFSYIACFIAPRGKVIVGVIMTTLLFVLVISISFFTINIQYYPLDGKIHVLISGATMLIASVYGVITIKDDMGNT